MAPPTLCIVALVVFQAGVAEIIATARWRCVLERASAGSVSTSTINRFSMPLFLFHTTGMALHRAVRYARGRANATRRASRRSWWWLYRPLAFIGPLLFTLPVIYLFGRQWVKHRPHRHSPRRRADLQCCSPPCSRSAPPCSTPAGTSSPSAPRATATWCCGPSSSPPGVISLPLMIGNQLMWGMPWQGYLLAALSGVRAPALHVAAGQGVHASATSRSATRWPAAAVPRSRRSVACCCCATTSLRWRCWASASWCSD